MQQVFSRVSVARDELDGPQVDDQGLTQTDSRNIAVADQYINAIPTDVSPPNCLPAVWLLPEFALHEQLCEGGRVDCTWVSPSSCRLSVCCSRIFADSALLAVLQIRGLTFCRTPQMLINMATVGGSTKGGKTVGGFFPEGTTALKLAAPQPGA